MHFVDKIHFVATFRRCILHVLKKLAGIFHFSARGSIHFNQINEAVLIDFNTGRTCTTGLRANAAFTVQALSKNTRDGRFTNTAGTSKQIGMM